MTPRTTRRAGAFTLVAAAVAGVLAGCDSGMGARLTYDDIEKVKVTEIVVAGDSGDVLVKTGAIAETRIKRIVRSTGADPGVSYKLDKTVLNLDTSCGQNCYVSYEIEAPTGVAVRGRLRSGDVSLTDVTAVDLTVNSGNIVIERATGKVSARTTSGDITAVGLGGEATLLANSGDVDALEVSGGEPIRAVATSGNVNLTLIDPAPVTAQASSGDVNLILPVGSYQLRTAADSGDQEIVGITNDPAGTHVIDARTRSGDLRIATGLAK